MKKYILLLLLFTFSLASFLRIYNISMIPVGLYIDEVSIAYNAYSILTTGKDEHGKAYPFAFQAFGEYKMPVYIYMTSGSLALFGKNEFAVRIPAAFFGSLTVVLFYFFAKELIFYEKKLDKKQQQAFAYVSTFLLAISPWHIQFSRAGFEATVAVFFFLLGLLLFLYYVRKQKKFLLFFSFLFLVCCLYTYTAFWIISPLCIGVLCTFLFFRFPQNRKTIGSIGVFALLCALPMLFFSLTFAGQARFLQVSAFVPNGHTAFLFYPLEYISNYLKYFSFSYLFSYGDGIGRHMVFRMGPNFTWEIIFLLAGIFFLVREKFSFFSASILFLFFLSPLAASLALPSPHLLRSLPLVFPVTLLVSYGVVNTWIYRKKKYILFGAITFLACLEFLLYLDFYYNFAPVTLADWGGQYKELIAKVAIYNKLGTPIFINDNVGMNPIYVKFYNPAMRITLVDDSWKKPASLSGKNIVYVTASNKKKGNMLLSTVTTPDKYHTVLYTIWKLY